MLTYAFILSHIPLSHVVVAPLVINGTRTYSKQILLNNRIEQNKTKPSKTGTTGQNREGRDRREKCKSRLGTVQDRQRIKRQKKK